MTEEMPKATTTGIKYCRCGDMFGARAGGPALCGKCEEAWRAAHADDAETVASKGE